MISSKNLRNALSEYNKFFKQIILSITQTHFIPTDIKYWLWNIGCGYLMSFLYLSHCLYPGCKTPAESYFLKKKLSTDF